ncbi:hypothetical protein FOL47_000388 [Perkinsus chesapeaki]|uniref:Uncharacterized protein n=1 Tax=Perkinsus chesapeaki TaxID=330153 RepID=A0A7J6MLU6_PERCH|nr:hypothetical protein FOL47_000388 [Perkinsus chesapeaki]
MTTQYSKDIPLLAGDYTIGNNTRSRGSSRKVHGVIFTVTIEVVLVCSWVLMGETTQAFPNLTHFPAVFAGVSCTSYILLLIPWTIMRRSRGLGLPNKQSILHLNNIMLILGTMWLVQIWFWYMSLKGMSVALNTIIYQTTPLVVFFLDLFIDGATPAYIPKLVCIVVAVFGIVVMSSSDTKESDGITNSITSCVEVSVATLLYGIFDILYAKWASPVCSQISNTNIADKDSDSIKCQVEDILLLLGLRAVPACIFLIFTLCIGAYHNNLPDYSQSDILAMLCVTLADWAFNIAMCIGLVSLSPLWVTMGTILCVPTALIFDMLVKGLRLSSGAWAGAVLTAVGFIAYNVIAAKDDHRWLKVERQCHALLPLSKDIDG